MSGRRLTLADLPERNQLEVIAQTRPKPLPPRAAAAPNREAKPGKRLRQAAKGPNATERAWTAMLRASLPGSPQVFEQAVTLVLANGLRYTPDNFVPKHPKGRPTFYEVKGFMRDDAAAKIKIAAQVHAWADFYLVTKRTKRAGGGWAVEQVLPLFHVEQTPPATSR